MNGRIHDTVCSQVATEPAAAATVPRGLPRVARANRYVDPDATLRVDLARSQRRALSLFESQWSPRLVTCVSGHSSPHASLARMTGRVLAQSSSVLVFAWFLGMQHLATRADGAEPGSTLPECAPWFASRSTNTSIKFDRDGQKAQEFSKTSCDVSESRSFIVLETTASSDVMPLNSSVQMTLVTVSSRTLRRCTNGGSSFFAGLIGPALLPGVVLDLGNGNYSVRFPWTGLTPGVYRLHVYVELDGYEASTECSTGVYVLGLTKRIRMARLTSANHTFTMNIDPPIVARVPEGYAWRVVKRLWRFALPYWRSSQEKENQRQGSVKSIATDVAGRALGRHAGYWVIDPHAQPYNWKTRCESKFFRRSTQLFPRDVTHGFKWEMPFASPQGDMRAGDVVRTFSGRWIHFIGKSMMTTTQDTFSGVLINAFHSADPQKPLRVPVEKETHPLSCRGNGQTKIGFYFRKFDTIITGLCHDVPDSLSFNIDVHFACIFETWNTTGVFAGAAGKARFTAGPDVVVYNRGLHIAAGLNNTSDIARFHAGESRVMSAFSTSLASKRSLLILKSTPSTHFNPGRLPRAWMCRTTARITCINAVSRSVADAIPGARWQLADMHSLALMRPDCQKDNRHNHCSNCRFAFVQVLFRMMRDGMRPRESEA